MTEIHSSERAADGDRHGPRPRRTARGPCGFIPRHPRLFRFPFKGVPEWAAPSILTIIAGEDDSDRSGRAGWRQL